MGTPVADNNQPTVIDAKAKPPSYRMSYAFALVLNLLLWFGISAWDKDPIQAIFGMIFLFFWGLPIGAVLQFVRRRTNAGILPLALQIPVNLSPTILLLLCGAIMEILGLPPAKANQTNPACSLDQRYSVRVSTRAGYWVLTIFSQKGDCLHKEHTYFVSHFSIYWIWDQADRLWIFNSDNGMVYYMHQLEGYWRMAEWGAESSYYSLAQTAPFSPPTELFPKYCGIAKRNPDPRRPSRQDGRQASKTGAQPIP